MKKILKYFIGLLLVLLICILSAATYIFFKPEVVINTYTLRYALEHTSILKDVNWKKGSLDIGWTHWNERPFKGYFKDFCFTYNSNKADLTSCLREVSWDLTVKFNFSEGLSVTSPGPIVLHASKTDLVIKEGKEKTNPKQYDLKSYWDLFWGPIVPNLSIEFLNTHIVASGKKLNFNLHAAKEKNEFSLTVLGYHLKAKPHYFILTVPRKYKLPFSSVSYTHLTLPTNREV